MVEGQSARFAEGIDRQLDHHRLPSPGMSDRTELTDHELRIIALWHLGHEAAGTEEDQL